jgi:regulatory protein
MKTGRGKKDRPEPSAYQRALGLLVRRDHSRRELSRKLRARGIESEEADAALLVLARQDFQNDARFAEALARTRAVSGYGPRYIRAELGTHGLTREDIEAALLACDTDWTESARLLVGRRYGNKDMGDPAVRRKAVDFLLRRGFDHKAASAAGRERTGDEEFED